MRTKIRQVKMGIVLSYIEIVAQMLVNFAFTPLMLRVLGQSEYGLYSTAISTISTLSILSLGFSSSYIKKYSEYNNRNDVDSISSLNGLYIIIFSIIGIIALACGLFLTFNLKLIYGTGLTAPELEKARVLMFILAFNLALNFPLSVFNSIIAAHEKFIFQKLVHMIKHVLSPLLMIPIMLMGFASVGMVITTVVCTLGSDIIAMVYCFHKLSVRIKFRDWEKGLLQQLFRYTAFIAINMLVDQINWNVDKVIIGRYRGTSSVAVYSVGHTIHSCYLSLANNITNVFIPKVHAISSKFKEDVELCSKEFTALFIKVGRVQYLVLALICTGFIFYGQFFVKWWAGAGYDNAYYVILLLMIPSTIAFIQTLGVEIQRSLNKHHFRSLFYLGMALCNVVVSVFFCKWWGEVGSALGTAIALILADGIAMNIYYQKALRLDILSFWKQILKMSKALVFPTIFGVLSMTIIYPHRVLVFFAEVIIYSVIYSVSMYIIAMNDFEKKLVVDVLKKLKIVR